MNTEGHIMTDVPLIQDKHSGCLAQEDQMGGFLTNTLVDQDPLRRTPDRGEPPGKGPC